MHDDEKLAKSIALLFNALSHQDRIVTVKTGGLVSVNSMPEPECFLIHRGHALLRRTEDQLILAKMSAPVIFGFNKYQNLNGKVYLEALTDIDFEIVPASSFYATIQQHSLWEPLLDVMMFISSELFRKNNALTARDSWSVIRSQLEELINEPSFIRSTTSAHDYIQQRTHLSRSGIMKHLSILRKQKLIEMENGILLSAARLPKKLT